MLCNKAHRPTEIILLYNTCTNGLTKCCSTSQTVSHMHITFCRPSYSIIAYTLNIVRLCNSVETKLTRIKGWHFNFVVVIIYDNSSNCAVTPFPNIFIYSIAKIHEESHTILCIQSVKMLYIMGPFMNNNANIGLMILSRTRTYRWEYKNSTLKVQLKYNYDMPSKN